MRRRRVGDVVVASAGLVVLIACGFVVRDGTVGSFELRVFHAINGLPDALTPVMNAAQLLGVLVVGPVVAAAALILRRWRLGFAALLVTAGKLLAERTVWELAQRSRPGTTISDAVVRAGAPASGVSFVSGHVVFVTGLAWVITPYLRGRWRFVPWLVVALVTFARVYLGAHAPLDVVGGVGLGLLVGGLTNLVVGIPGAAGDRRRDPVTLAPRPLPAGHLLPEGLHEAELLAAFSFFAWRFSFSDLLAAVFELLEPPLSLLAMACPSLGKESSERRPYHHGERISMPRPRPAARRARCLSTSTTLILNPYGGSSGVSFLDHHANGEAFR